jgi:hypothetical protein
LPAEQFHGLGEICQRPREIETVTTRADGGQFAKCGDGFLSGSERVRWAAELGKSNTEIV